MSAYPTLFQLPFRRIVARSGDEVRVGWLSLVAPRPIAWERFEAASGPGVEAARLTEEARVFEWFAMGEATPRVEATADGAVVEIDDLRFGFPGRPRDGLWGVRVRLDAAGWPVGPGERFDRALPGVRLRARRADLARDARDLVSLLDARILLPFDRSGFRRQAASFRPEDLEVDLSGRVWRW